MRFWLASILAFALFVSPHAAAGTPQNFDNVQSAQSRESVAPAHVAFVEGSATLERDGRPETAPLNMPLLSGDRLKTLNGRVEVLFGDGSALHIDSETTIDLQSEELMRLIDGRLRLAIAGGDAAQARSTRVAYRVDSPAGSVRVLQPGEYRVALLRRAEETQLELAVLRGFAEIFTEQGTTEVRAGERAYASAGLAPSYAYAYNSANMDAFDQWSEARRDTRLGVSSQYLPSDVRAYSSTFDEEGDWRYNTPYGYVWYPRVAAGWRPYYYGRWAQYPRYGWTWVGVDRFAWPTHHYGRWGFSLGSWFWIPGVQWAPAHVSWAYAPGYVSWCPLGFDNRPVIAVNYYNVGPGYYSSWRAWTAVGYSHFGRGYVHQRAVHWNDNNWRAHPSFRVAQAGPAYRDVAVPRSAPIRTVGSRTTTSAVSDSRAVVTTPLPPSGIRSGARTPVSGSSSPRTSTTAQGAPSRVGERYINRGDEIVRSQTERPSSPARTTPAGPAQRIEAPSAEHTRMGRDAGIYAPRSPYERGSVTARPDAPAYQPPMRTYERTAPPAAPANEGRQAVPRPSPDRGPAPDAGSRDHARPRPSTEAQGAPSRVEGRGMSDPGPSRAEGRATPAPGRSAPSGGSSGTAVPRDGGVRSAPPAAGGASGARTPRGGGRGGV